MARISVVIATYNRAQLLQATLEQLARQAYEAGDEVVIVDNASNDTTAATIARAAAAFPVPLEHLYERTPGKSSALNAGIAAAHGDVLALTDDDVLVADDWLSTIRDLFSDPSLALVGGRVDPLWERPAPSWLQVESGDGYGAMSSPLALLHYGKAQPLGDRTAVGANIAVRRSVMEALGGFAPHLGRNRSTLLCGEDHDFCQRVVAAGYRAEYRPELRVRHWVPAVRLRLRYFVRWFFWSGVTNAVLEEDTRCRAGDPAPPAVPLYLVRRLVTTSISTVARLLSGRIAAAARCVMEISFALGFLGQHIYERRPARRGTASTASEMRAARGNAPPVAAVTEPPTVGRAPDQAAARSEQMNPA